MPGEGPVPFAPERRPKHRRKDHHAKVFHDRPLSLIFDSRGIATRPLPAPRTADSDGPCPGGPDRASDRWRLSAACVSLPLSRPYGRRASPDRLIKLVTMYDMVQTSNHLSATRTPTRGIMTATRQRRGRKNEILDCFLFVTWTGRLLQRRSIRERRRLRSRGGFIRLCAFSGAEHSHRPVVQPTGRESVRVELIAVHYPALPGNGR
jgi:hypothetical protein